PMEVKVANRTYRMGKKEYQGLLKVASEQVPFGIYAVEKNGYAELMNIKCNSITQLKQKIRKFRSQGWKVHQNGR
ncbi:hypothetical protein NE619_17990, partial [Anaerovorax odorimutans]